MTSEYEEFLKSKVRAVPDAGFEWDRRKLPRLMFDWQKDVCRWGLRKGRAAMFLDTGLGKSAVSLAWADAVCRHTDKPTLILTPLAVGPQFVREAGKFGVKGVELWTPECKSRIRIANYQKLHLIDATAFGGVVLDESSILKSYSGSTNAALRDAFAGTPYRLCCTATPSPNDVEELGNHAAFLGVCTRVEMLATYFVHDSSDTSKWRLKGHAEADFWKWVAGWAMVMRHPRDIGFDAPAGYDLPPLNIVEHTVASPPQPGRLVAVPAETLSEQRDARRLTMADRVKVVADLVNASDEDWIVWCELNDEGDALEKAIHNSVQVSGSDTDDHKQHAVLWFAGLSCECQVSDISSGSVSSCGNQSTQQTAEQSTQATLSSENEGEVKEELQNKTLSTCEHTTPPTSTRRSLSPKKNATRETPTAESGMPKTLSSEPKSSPSSRCGRRASVVSQDSEACSESLRLSTTPCSQIRVADVLSAGQQKETAEESVCTSITVTQAAPSEVSSAVLATSASEISATTPKGLTGLRCICGRPRTRKVLIGKPSQMGFGMNWQHCNNIAFVGISHSFEQFYQAVRRCWRFGQTRPVTAHVVTSDIESGVLANVMRKQAGHDALFANMVRHTAAVNRADVTAKTNRKDDRPVPVVQFIKPRWM